jgi:hypothetical protein
MASNDIEATAQAMDTDMDNFVTALADQTPTHKDWLVLVRFGLGTLLENQPLFAEVIVREATRIAEQDIRATVVAGDFIASILRDLNLKLVVMEENR